MSKRPSLLAVGNELKKMKVSEPPWKRGPSTWKGSDVTIMQPFLKIKSMTQRDIQFNKYLGGKVDFDLLYNLLFQYLLPLLDVIQESLGGEKAGELNTCLSFVALPIMIRVLCKKERDPAPAKLPQSQAERIEAAVKLLQELPNQLQCSEDVAAGQSAGMSVWCDKVKDLAEGLSKMLHVADSTSEQEDEDFEGDPEFVRFKTAEDQEDERDMLEDEVQQAQSEVEPSASETVSTPKEQVPEISGAASTKSSPDSQYDPDFVHEMHMGQWSVDLGMKVRDKRFPGIKLVKNLIDGKGAATIIVDSESAGGVNQLVGYSCWNLLFNSKEGRYSPIFSQLFNVSRYLGAEAVLTTVIKLSETGEITAEALEEAQQLQREVWKQQHPTQAFDERTLVSMASLKSQLHEAERRLKVDFDLPKDEAKLRPGRYVVGDFYRNDKLHAFLTLPLEQEPAASTWAFLESQLRIGLGERVTKWTWEDVKLRLEEDLEMRRARQTKVLVNMNKTAWRKTWRKQGQAKSLKDLVFPKESLL